jgi:intracellular septation protein A
MTAIREITEEFRSVLLGRVPIVDTVVPPLVFVAANAVAGLYAGAGVAIASALAITSTRLLRRRPARFAVAGLGGVIVAVAFATWSGSAAGFFLPGIVTGTLTAGMALLSITAGRPMVAWTSMLVRRWPAAWYRHPRVLPAYREVTWVWAIFFAGRTTLQWNLAQDGELGALAAVRVLGGWPALVILLIATYLYGTWRLRRLDAPSVEEFRTNAPPPWNGQRRGF